MTNNTSHNIKRFVAGVCALTLVSGTVPVQPVAEFFAKTAIQASAATYSDATINVGHLEANDIIDATQHSITLTCPEGLVFLTRNDISVGDDITDYVNQGTTGSITLEQGKKYKVVEDDSGYSSSVGPCVYFTYCEIQPTVLTAESTTWTYDCTITGDLTINSAVTVSDNITLTIPAGKTLTVNGGISAGEYTLTVKGAGTLNVTGAGGSDGADGYYGGNATNGGDGFIGNLVVDGATVNVTGGNGGDGGDGGDGDDGGDDGAGGDGYAGGDAGNGGNGGNGVRGNVTVNSGNAAINGGIGGEGGNGGNGGNGGDNDGFGNGGSGGNGGYGGNGGNGGNGVYGSVTVNSGKAAINGGEGGEGGIGGFGGNGGFGGMGDGFGGAPGGIGGDGGEGKAVSDTITADTVEYCDDGQSWQSEGTYAGSGPRFIKAETKQNVTVTAAPAAVTGLTYDGKAKALVTAGTAVNGTVMYTAEPDHELVADNSMVAKTPKVGNVYKPTGTSGIYFSGYKYIEYTEGEKLPVKINAANKGNANIYALDQNLKIHNSNGNTPSFSEYDAIQITGLEGDTIECTLVKAENVVLEANWSDTVPQATDAGDYSVRWYVKGNEGYNDTEKQTIDVKIAKGNLTANDYTAPTAKTFYADGNEKELITEGAIDSSKGTFEYATGKLVDERNSGSAYNPVIGDVVKPTGSSGVYFPKKYSLKIGGITYSGWSSNDDNYYGINLWIVSGTKKVSYVDDSVANAILSAWGNHDCFRVLDVDTTNKVVEIEFIDSADYLNSLTWSANVPKAKDVGTYPVMWRIKGSSNYNDKAGGTLTAEIKAKADITDYTAPEAKTNLTYDGKAKALVTAGTAVNGTVMYTTDPDVELVTGDYQTVTPKVGNVYKPTGSEGISFSGYKYIKYTEGENSAVTTDSVYHGHANIYKFASQLWIVKNVENGGYNDIAFSAYDAIQITGLEGDTIECTLVKADDVVLEATWSDTVPEATNAGNYSVRWYVKGNEGYNDTDEQTVAASIGKGNLTADTDYTAPAAKTLYADGTDQELIAKGTGLAASKGTFEYALGKPVEERNSYDEYNPVVGDVIKPYGIDGVYFPKGYSLKIDNNTYDNTNVNFGIQLTQTNNNREAYNTSSYNAIVTAWGTNDCFKVKAVDTVNKVVEIEFIDSAAYLNSLTWSETVPKAKDVGTYPVSWRIKSNDSNYNNVAGGTINAEIANKRGSVSVVGLRDARFGYNYVITDKEGNIIEPVDEDHPDQYSLIGGGTYYIYSDSTVIKQSLTDGFKVKYEGDGEKINEHIYDYKNKITVPVLPDDDGYTISHSNNYGGSVNAETPYKLFVGEDGKLNTLAAEMKEVPVIYYGDQIDKSVVDIMPGFGSAEGKGIVTVADVYISDRDSNAKLSEGQLNFSGQYSLTAKIYVDADGVIGDTAYYDQNGFDRDAKVNYLKRDIIYMARPLALCDVYLDLFAAEEAQQQGQSVFSVKLNPQTAPAAEGQVDLSSASIDIRPDQIGEFIDWDDLTKQVKALALTGTPAAFLPEGFAAALEGKTDEEIKTYLEEKVPAALKKYFTYNGSEQQPVLRVVNAGNGETLTLPAAAVEAVQANPGDYTSSLEAQKNAGEYNFTLKAVPTPEGDNPAFTARYSGAITGAWAIQKATAYITMTPNNNVDTDEVEGVDAIVYDGKKLDLKDFTFTVKTANDALSQEVIDGLTPQQATDASGNPAVDESGQPIMENAKTTAVFTYKNSDDADVSEAKDAGSYKTSVTLKNSNFENVKITGVSTKIAKREVEIDPYAASMTYRDVDVPDLAFAFEQATAKETVSDADTVRGDYTTYTGVVPGDENVFRQTVITEGEGDNPPTETYVYADAIIIGKKADTGLSGNDVPSFAYKDADGDPATPGFDYTKAEANDAGKYDYEANNIFGNYVVKLKPKNTQVPQSVAQFTVNRLNISTLDKLDIVLKGVKEDRITAAEDWVKSDNGKSGYYVFDGTTKYVDVETVGYNPVAGETGTVYDYTLTKGTDYTVGGDTEGYLNNMTYAVQVKGKGNYTGVAKQGWDMTDHAAGNAELVVDRALTPTSSDESAADTFVVYNGEPVTAKVEFGGTEEDKAYEDAVTDIDIKYYEVELEEGELQDDPTTEDEDESKEQLTEIDKIVDVNEKRYKIVATIKAEGYADKEICEYLTVVPAALYGDFSYSLSYGDTVPTAVTAADIDKLNGMVKADKDAVKAAIAENDEALTIQWGEYVDDEWIDCDGSVGNYIGHVVWSEDLDPIFARYTVVDEEEQPTLNLNLKINRKTMKTADIVAEFDNTVIISDAADFAAPGVVSVYDTRLEADPVDEAALAELSNEERAELQAEQAKGRKLVPGMDYTIVATKTAVEGKFDIQIIGKGNYKLTKKETWNALTAEQANESYNKIKEVTNVEIYNFKATETTTAIPRVTLTLKRSVKKNSGVSMVETGILYVQDMENTTPLTIENAAKGLVHKKSGTSVNGSGVYNIGDSTGKGVRVVGYVTASYGDYTTTIYTDEVKTSYAEQKAIKAIKDATSISLSDPSATINSTTGAKRVSITQSRKVAEGFRIVETGFLFVKDKSSTTPLTIGNVGVGGVTKNLHVASNGSKTLHITESESDQKGVRVVGFATVTDGVYTTTIYTREVATSYAELS